MTPETPHRDRLLSVLKEAHAKTQTWDNSKFLRWKNEILEGRNLSESFKIWLDFQADYWMPKDREYGQYLRSLWD